MIRNAHESAVESVCSVRSSQPVRSQGRLRLTRFSCHQCHGMSVIRHILGTAAERKPKGQVRRYLCGKECFLSRSKHGHCLVDFFLCGTFIVKYRLCTGNGCRKDVCRFLRILSRLIPDFGIVQSRVGFRHGCFQCRFVGFNLNYYRVLESFFGVFQFCNGIVHFFLCCGLVFID